jgi:hypothetical protein
MSKGGRGFSDTWGLCAAKEALIFALLSALIFWLISGLGANDLGAALGKGGAALRAAGLAAIAELGLEAIAALGRELDRELDAAAFGSAGSKYVHCTAPPSTAASAPSLTHAVSHSSTITRTSTSTSLHHTPLFSCFACTPGSIFATNLRQACSKLSTLLATAARSTTACTTTSPRALQ